MTSYEGPMKHLAALAVAAAVLSAQDAANKPEFTVRSNLVFLPTRVQSAKGATIYGLKPEQFIVEDNGVRQPVSVEEDPDSTGVSLVVAVQCSRSAVSEFNKLKGLGSMIGAIVAMPRMKSRSSATEKARMSWAIFPAAPNPSVTPYRS